MSVNDETWKSSSSGRFSRSGLVLTTSRREVGEMRRARECQSKKQRETQRTGGKRIQCSRHSVISQVSHEGSDGKRKSLHHHFTGSSVTNTSNPWQQVNIAVTPSLDLPSVSFFRFSSFPSVAVHIHPFPRQVKASIVCLSLLV